MCLGYVLACILLRVCPILCVVFFFGGGGNNVGTRKKGGTNLKKGGDWSPCSPPPPPGSAYEMPLRLPLELLHHSVILAKQPASLDPWPHPLTLSSGISVLAKPYHSP